MFMYIVCVSIYSVRFYQLVFMIGIHSSNPGHPFCSGITLSKLAAVTTDEQGNETFNTSGALDKLCKVRNIPEVLILQTSLFWYVI